ncbi:MAG: response regulator [Candidatus Omnitrophica bacterium]|nr:response regulator [Candidatus Omnitrophota bacterium]MBU1925517.1 response regulator [Candidatus Omnitrophota bacterium]
MKSGISNLLVVDDEAVVRDMLRHILIDEGFNVLVAEDGKSAVNTAKENDLDLALIDIKLPDTNGVQVLEKIKIFRPNLKAIMMTAYENEDLIRQALKEGAYACLFKPFDIAALLDMFEKII